MSVYDEARPAYGGRPPRTPVWPFFFPLLLVLVAGGLLLWWFWPARFGASVHDPNAAPRPVAPRGELSELEKSNIHVFREAAPSVAYVTTLTVRRDIVHQEVQEMEGTGSGFVWDENGYIVTNYHVIQNSDEAKVTLTRERGQRQTYEAVVVGQAPDNDLAVLKINARGPDLRPILVGSSKDLQVGQLVYAIGNPFGLDHTLTTGIVSALDREIRSVNRRPLTGMIQTDAAINPGNSGGPLLDSAGRLIGVNTAIYSPSGAYAGIGFAIPVDTVNQVVPELIRRGKAARPGLGLVMAPERVAQKLGVKNGVLVGRVMPNSAASKAGLKPSWVDEDDQIHVGDIITAIEGEAVKAPDDLHRQLAKRQVGDTITLTVRRNGEEQEVQATLQAMSQ
jgi:S1-C subfamily serine protease